MIKLQLGEALIDKFDKKHLIDRDVYFVRV